MSAALCGPSNALTSLQKYTTADRSNQRDRFHHRPSLQTHIFRSRAAQSNDSIDQEFNQFAAHPQPIPHGLHSAPFAAGFDIDNSQDWSASLQQLDIGPPQHFHAPPRSSLELSATTSWANEFAQTQSLRQVVYNTSNQHSTINHSFGHPDFCQVSPPLEVNGVNRTQLSQQPEFQFDESAFEQAFNDAARLAELQKNDTLFQKDEQPVIKPDVNEDAHEEQSCAKDSDDIARVAGQLLDSVQNNSSQKFQNSSFFALMRRLRDHEVVVEGDKMVEAR